MGNCKCTDNALQSELSPRETSNIPEAYQGYVFHESVLAGGNHQVTPFLDTSESFGGFIYCSFHSDENREYTNLAKTQKLDYFVDQSFPPDRQSICGDRPFPRADNVTWKRPPDFLAKDEIRIFENKVEPKDIKQGQLGDCYFLSSLSSLAERENLIKRLFITQEYQPNGLHGVYLCHNGQFKEVAIDDHIPCKDKYPIFSRANGNELWVLLLEKAYAKIYGGYDKIEAGLAGCALRDLTGAPYEYHIRQKEDQIEADQCWNFLWKYNEKNYILTASSERNEKGVEHENEGGIISQHCYAILDIQNVVGSDGKEDRIIQLRNPWGRKEWTGDWSDSSAKWTPELREKFGIKLEDEGIFWISIIDFVKEFSQVCVCKLHDDYKYTYQMLNPASYNDTISQKIITMTVTQQTHGFVSLNQVDKRMFSKTQFQYRYSLARVIVAKVNPQTNQLQVLKGQSFDIDREVVVEGDFEPGDYIIYVELQWVQNQVRNSVISFYGSSQVVFKEAPTTSPQETENIFDEMIRLFSFTHNQHVHVHNYSKDIVRYNGSFAGYVFYYYLNGNSNQMLNEEVTIQNRQHIEICNPFKNSDKFAVSVGSGQSQIVKFRVQSSGGGGFAFKPQTSYKLINEYTEAQLIQQAKDKPEKTIQRKIDNQGVDVYLYVFNYSAGIALVYENGTSQKYSESLKLNVSNLKCGNFDVSQEQTIVVPGNGTYLLNLKTVNLNQPPSYSLQVRNERME